MTDYIKRQDAIDKFKPWLEVKGYTEGEVSIDTRQAEDLRMECEIMMCHVANWAGVDEEE